MNQRPVKASFASMIPGLVIVAFGGLIMWKPEIMIRWVFGGFFVLMGLGVILAARKVSRTRVRIQNIKDQFQSGFGGGFGAPPTMPPDGEGE